MWLLLACQDYDLTEKDAQGGFDTGDDPPDFETAEESDTAPPEETSEPAECPDRSFPAEPLALDDDCTYVPSVGSFTPVTEWAVSSFADEPSFNNVMAMPVVISLTDDDGDGYADDDDVPDVVFPAYAGTDWTGEGVLRALSGDDGRELWTLAGAGVQACAGVAAADLDDDGFPEVLATTSSSRLLAVAADGSVLWTSDTYTTTGYVGPGPAIADMDEDGEPEIVVGTTILDSTGGRLATMAGTDAGTGTGYASLTFPVDLDGDGVMEVVAGETVYAMDGSVLWSNGSRTGTPAVADLDLDGTPEILVTSSSAVRALSSVDGSTVWEYSRSGTAGPPTVADYDGDGLPEVGYANNAEYTVIDDDGSVLWRRPTTDASSGVTGSAVFDFEGDGVAVVVYADEVTVWGFNGPDGAVKLSSSDHSNWTVVEYPPIADVDGDGEAEIVVPNGLHPSYGGPTYGISVLGDKDHSWRSGRKIWNQHAYHITNVEDDGSVPRVQDRNWESYNNFRSGDLASLSAGEGTNVVAKIHGWCLDECASDRLVIWVSLGNRGPAEVSRDLELRVELEGATGWAEAAIVPFPGPLVSGAWTEGVEIVLTSLPSGPITALRVTADPTDAEAECHEDDNVDEVFEVLCP